MPTICLKLFFLSLLCILFAGITVGQEEPSKVDSFYKLQYDGILGKVAQAIVIDSNGNGRQTLQRNDKRFQRYRGRIIRNIVILRVPFGTSIQDTAASFRNFFTNLADKFHTDSREQIIRNNLFFVKNDSVHPYLLADNERHLRDLEYLGDARITVTALRHTRDSVDITVFTKDVLSLGGRLDFSSIEEFQASIREDNLAGYGDRLEFRTLFDYDRRVKVGLGMQYVRRNILGTFIDASVGWQNFAPTLHGGHKQENVLYVGLNKPLVHPYMKWTYGMNASLHSTRNLYLPDSLFNEEYHYSYRNVDAWGGITFDPHFRDNKTNDARLRTYLGLRLLHQNFTRLPLKYTNEYFYRFANMEGALVSMSLFTQNFFRARYFYGFGRTEDVPEGFDVAVTAGWIRKEKRSRGYLGMDLQLNYFSPQEHYFNYTLRAGTFSRRKSFEDLDVLLNAQFFSNLRTLGTWKQRTNISLGITKQWNTLLNGPLYINSEYGLQEFSNDSLFGGNFRASAKAESVFYSNWSLIGFRFAPFVFAHGAYLDGDMADRYGRKFFPSLGGGLRTRNESLIFGTVELRGFYFPSRNFYNENFRVDISTNLRFKYNQSRLKRPEIINFN